VIQSSKGNQKGSAGEASHCMDCCNHRSHQQVGQDTEPSLFPSTGNISEKKSSKAPVDKDYEADSSSSSDDTPPSGVTPTEDSTFEDSLIYGKGKAPAPVNASRADPDDVAKKAQAYIDRLKAVL
jgi:hypothetical protein